MNSMLAETGELNVLLRPYIAPLKDSNEVSLDMSH